MSQPSADWSAEDAKAAAAVVNHHAELSDALNRRTETLVATAETAPAESEPARTDLLGFLRSELVPHARAEEQVLYPAAAAQPAGMLLIDGMLAEHHTIVGLIEEIASAPSAVRAAAAARALAAVFATHLAKENDLVIPLLAGAPDVSLAHLLEGMHELLGAEAHVAHTHEGTGR